MAIDYKHLASLGRFGDNKIRDIDGKPAHVNAFEAWQYDNLPRSTAERMIKANGAGTRNPSTGLKEYHENNKKIWEKGWHPHPHFNQIDDWLADRMEESAEAVYGEDLDFSWNQGFTVAESGESPPPGGVGMGVDQFWDHMSDPNNFSAMMDEHFDGDESLFYMSGADYADDAGRTIKDIAEQGQLDMQKIMSTRDDMAQQTSGALGTIRQQSRERGARTGFENIGGQTGGGSFLTDTQSQLDRLLSTSRGKMGNIGLEIKQSQLSTENKIDALKNQYYKEFMDLKTQTRLGGGG